MTTCRDSTTSDEASYWACSAFPPTFPPRLIAHCVASGIPPGVFYNADGVAINNLPRYVRLHPALALRWGVKEREGNLAAEMGVDVSAVQHIRWLPCDAYAVPRACAVNNLQLYRQGHIIPMDAASMAAVAALRPRVGDRVLDLCCSPGMKLNLILDAVTPPASSTAPRTDLVVGVDINVQRLYVARAQVLKHRDAGRRDANAPADARQQRTELEPSVCLLAADGCDVEPEAALRAVLDNHSTARIHEQTGLTAKEERMLRSLAKRQRDENNSNSSTNSTVPPPPTVAFASQTARKHFSVPDPAMHDHSGGHAWDGLFDRVLVDAECTHDGSLAHLDTSHEHTPRPKEGITNTTRMERINTAASNRSPDCPHPPDQALADLQLALLMNGFRHLRPGGTLVYCTCSFSFWQNEYIVHRFLQTVNGTSSGEGPSEAIIASVCPAFSFSHEEEGMGGSSTHSRPLRECMGTRTDSYTELQRRLDACSQLHGIVPSGWAALSAISESSSNDNATPLQIGSRLWPSEFNTSFQYVAKIHKRPTA